MTHTSNIASVNPATAALNLLPVEHAVVTAVRALQGQYVSKRTGKRSHGVHAVYSGITANLKRLAPAGTDPDTFSRATIDRLIARGVLFGKPSRGGISLATTPFPTAAWTSAADEFFAQ
jgi:hypothetical protein